jgi:hypothetical protein
MAAFRSNLPAFIRAMDDAAPKGLLAGAYVVANQVKRNLRGGYTSGDFVTGASVNHVTIGQVFQEGTGWVIKVGTDLLYNLFWELGHHNIFTRKFERVEKWRPALVDSRFEAMQAYTRVYTQTLHAHGF